MHKALRSCFVFAGITLFVFSVFILTEVFENSQLSAHSINNMAAGKYYTMPKWKSGFYHKIKVHLIVKQSNPGQMIEAVSFAGTPLVLNPLSKIRGEAYVKLKPGSYPLKWEILQKKTAKIERKEATITLAKDRLWVDITIDGDKYFTQ